MNAHFDSPDEFRSEMAQFIRIAFNVVCSHQANYRFYGGAQVAMLRFGEDAANWVQSLAVIHCATGVDPERWAKAHADKPLQAFICAAERLASAGNGHGGDKA